MVVHYLKKSRRFQLEMVCFFPVFSIKNIEKIPTLNLQTDFIATPIERMLKPKVKLAINIPYNGIDCYFNIQKNFTYLPVFINKLLLRLSKYKFSTSSVPGTTKKLQLFNYVRGFTNKFLLQEDFLSNQFPRHQNYMVLFEIPILTIKTSSSPVE